MRLSLTNSRAPRLDMIFGRADRIGVKADMLNAASQTDANKAEDTGGQEVRLSSRLSMMHLAASAVLIASILLGTFWLAIEHNRQAAIYTQQMIEAKFTSFGKRLRATNRDYSVWTEAYDAILASDMPWLYSNIGTGAAEIGALDLIVLVPPGTGEPFGWRPGSPEAGEADLLPPDLIERMLGLLRGTAPSERVVKSAYALLDGEAWLLTVTRVIPVDGVPADVPDADVPRQIQGVRIEPTLLKEIKESFILQEAKISDVAAPGQRSHPIDSINTDETIGIVWTAPTPGTVILARAAVPLAFIILAFVTVAVLISRYSTRAARRLEHALVEAQAADRAKSEFLGIVSHELRTPMNGIIGLGQLMQENDLDDESREMLGTMMGCAMSQMRMIESLLDLTQMESGKRRLHKERFNLRRLLSEVVEVARIECQAKGLTLDVEDHSDPSTHLVGDPQAIRQIVTNLLHNAVKFTAEGGVVVRVGMAPVDSGHGERPEVDVRIDVCDTGIGIAAEDHERVFERLTQVDGSATRSADGIGLGLAICRSLAEIMGGRVDLASEVGGGSTFSFTVRLPAEVGNQRLAA